MKLTKQQKYLIVAITVAALLITVVAASTIITAPEHITGTPQPTPTPSPTPEPAVLHLTSNNTDPFYKGDTLRMTATLTPAQPGVTVTLYNNGVFVTTAATDGSGVAVFDRKPLNPFDYTASAELP